MTKKKAKDLQETIEGALAAMFDSTAAPDEGRMKLLTLGIKYLAVKNKLEENEYGDFFNEPGNADGVPEKPARSESGARRRANGAGAGAGSGEA